MHFYSWIYNFFHNFSLQALRFICHSHYIFNVQCVGYEQAFQMVMQAEWLAGFWCFSNQDQVLWFSRI